jgi:adenylate kinase family enzyme
MERQPTMITVIGIPGGGKSTLAEAITTHETYLGRAAHISLGQEVRDIRDGKRESEVSNDIARHFHSGDRFQLLRDDIVDQVAIEALRRHRGDSIDLMVLDGIPRRPDQMDDVLRNCASFNYRFGGIIHTTVEPQIALDRLTKRKRSPEEERLSVSDAVYRIDLYNANSAALPDTLQNRGITVRTVWTGGPKALTLYDALGHVKDMTAEPAPTHEAA